MGEGGCFNCHGYEGNGEGPRALGLKDDITNQAILPTDFTRGVFKRGSSLRELYLRVTTGIPGTPMPSTELTPRQRWGLAYYLRTFSAERK